MLGCVRVKILPHALLHRTRPRYPWVPVDRFNTEAEALAAMRAAVAAGEYRLGLYDAPRPLLSAKPDRVVEAPPGTPKRPAAAHLSVRETFPARMARRESVKVADGPS